MVIYASSKWRVAKRQLQQLPFATHPFQNKKRAGLKPCSKNCVDPVFPEKLDLILIDGATLLVRAWAPPETWTTRLDLAVSLSPYW
jgi:hypothetical protein